MNIFKSISSFLPVILVLVLMHSLSAKEVTIYVSPGGNNENSGLSNEQPLRNIQHALDKIPEIKKQGAEKINIRLMDGNYFLSSPIKIRPEHSGTGDNPVVISAIHGGKTIITGGRQIDGWKKTANGLWVTKIPDVKDKNLNFRQIYMDGQRRNRARIPNEGFKIVAGFPEGTPETVHYHTDCQSFEFAPGDIDPNWKNLDDVEVIVYHFWTDSHLPIQSIDTERNIVTFKHKAGKVFTDDFSEDGARYIVENVFEGLDAPGEWYLDRKTGQLYYYPFPEENIKSTKCTIPVTEKLIDVTGNHLSLNYVEGIQFENIIFECTNFMLPEGSSNDRQGSKDVSAAISIKGSRNCTFKNCEFQNLGNWAFEVLDGCSNNSFLQNKITNVAAGGFRINGGDDESHPLDRTGYTKIIDNEISHYGQVYLSAVGITLMQTNSNEVLHNHIHHGYYTGISVGWEWGYQRSISRDNKIEYNHIHDIGQGLLSDMGAIYTLGLSPGTVLRNNLIHDIESNHYGGWGIYHDEGTAHMLVENNIVYNTKYSMFNVHFSKEVTVRNNIFALGRIHQLSRSRVDAHQSFYFENNIVYWKEGELLYQKWEDEPYVFHFHPAAKKGLKVVSSNFEMDYNLFFNPGTNVEDIDFIGKSFEEWQKTGKDVHSLYADPMFVDAENFDFSLKPGSPAFKLGFKPIDMSEVGTRTQTGVIAN